MRYDLAMVTIPQRDLRNRSGEILRQDETGEELTTTVEGRPVALLVPYPKRKWVPKADYMKVLKAVAPDPTFFEDIAELGDTLEDIDDPWDR